MLWWRMSGCFMMGGVETGGMDRKGIVGQGFYKLQATVVYMELEEIS